jgi:excisionase family DNA binding protein
VLKVEPVTAQGDAERPGGPDDRSGAIQLTVTLSRDQLEEVARRVADLRAERQDDGFLSADRAARYLDTTTKALYHQVERGRIRAHRLGGRLLFDPVELRQDVERAQ